MKVLYGDLWLWFDVCSNYSGVQKDTIHIIMELGFGRPSDYPIDELNTNTIVLTQHEEDKKIRLGIGDFYGFNSPRTDGIKQDMLRLIKEENEIVVVASHRECDSIVSVITEVYKKKKIHLIIDISEDTHLFDDRPMLRLIQNKKVINSVCFLNTRAFNRKSDYIQNISSYLESVLDDISRLEIVNQGSIYLYDNENTCYNLVELTDQDYCYTDDHEHLLEHTIVSSGPKMCRKLTEYRREYAKKHNLDRVIHKRPYSKYCTGVCEKCDTESLYLWYDVEYKENLDTTRDYNHDSEANVWGIYRLRQDVDGPGLRTLVMMSGCPLCCKYCANNIHTQKRFHTDLSVSNLFYWLQKDIVYHEMSNGGITFGGGEPLLSPDFIYDFHVCHPEYNIAVETSLNIDFENVNKLIEAVDWWIIDIKDMNPDIYYKYTDSDNWQVIYNLEYLINTVGPERIVCRVPLINGYNSDADVNESINKLTRMGITRIEKFEYISD